MGITTCKRPTPEEASSFNCSISLSISDFGRFGRFLGYCFFCASGSAGKFEIFENHWNAGYDLEHAEKFKRHCGHYEEAIRLAIYLRQTSPFGVPNRHVSLRRITSVAWAASP